MFDGLKKKFSTFIDSLSRKEEQNAAEQQKAEPDAGQEPPAKAEEHAHEAPVQEERHEPHEAAVIEQAPVQDLGEHSESDARGRDEHHNEERRAVHMAEQPAGPVHQAPAQQPRQAQRQERAVPAAEEHAGRTAASGLTEQQPRQQERRAPKVSATTRIRGFIFGQVRISEKDAEPFIEELKIGMLQSDVNYDVAERIADSIRSSLVGRQVASRDINSEILGMMRGSIMGVLTKASPFDIVSTIKSSAVGDNLPFKILFLGPNGAGKTTTMAKVASMLMSNGITCVMSASDTFRAAAIEQTAFHAGKLGIGVVKGTYGADPASVAFDAISHARAHGIMAVLIDSAGRQETNKSLIEELKKMVRVAKPDMKIFIGESISGNALLEQVKALNEAVGLDGIILTKLDVDAKGGNTLSILSDTTVPILFFGTGEKYNDIIPYDPNFIVDNMLPSR